MKKLEIPPGARIDTLSGDFVIFQPEQGQRYTTDDMLVAWLAVRTAQEAEVPVGSFLDLGTGLGSVAMIVLWALSAARASGIEISARRAALARRSIAANNLGGRFCLLEGDLRRTNLNEDFTLVTSSPPYHESHEGPISPDRDKAGVRFELNGSLDDYFKAADRHLVRGGRFITVYPCRYRARVSRAAQRNGFTLDRCVDVIPRIGKPPLIALFSFVEGPAGRNLQETVPVRNEDRTFSRPYRRIRNMLGFPAQH